MRPLILLLFALCVAASCKTTKQTAADRTSSARFDHIAETRQTIATIDSAVRFAGFSFDTLRISIERSSENVLLPRETLSLTAVNGKIINCSKEEEFRTETFRGHDTIAMVRSESDKSSRTTATAKVASPLPAALFLILLTALLIHALKLRSR